MGRGGGVWADGDGSSAARVAPTSHWLRKKWASATSFESHHVLTASPRLPSVLELWHAKLIAMATLASGALHSPLPTHAPSHQPQSPWHMASPPHSPHDAAEWAPQEVLAVAALAPAAAAGAATVDAASRRAAALALICVLRAWSARTRARALVAARAMFGLWQHRGIGCTHALRALLFNSCMQTLSETGGRLGITSF